MVYELADLPSWLGAAAAEYQQRGFIVLDGVGESITSRFRDKLGGILGLPPAEAERAFAATSSLGVLPVEMRRQLARVRSDEALAGGLIETIGPLLQRLIGPLGHVSSTFHSQLKGAKVKAVDHGGYADDHLELHGAYLLHQDFTGANLPTSPSAVTLWTPLNTSPDWNLRLYPGSHRLGMLCNRWLELDDERVSTLGEPVDIQARAGQAVVFNSMILHGTSNPGPLQRVSCDIRFFPVCGFLPSRVVRFGSRRFDELADTAPGEVLLAPLLEAQVFLGRKTPSIDAPRLSALNWVNYVRLICEGERDRALPHLERFTNTEIGADPPETYAAKFHDRPVHPRDVQADGPAAIEAVA